MSDLQMRTPRQWFFIISTKNKFDDSVKYGINEEFACVRIINNFRQVA